VKKSNAKVHNIVMRYCHQGSVGVKADEGDWRVKTQIPLLNLILNNKTETDRKTHYTR